jgi:hypothetical protein
VNYKSCSKCKQEKPFSCFYRCKKGKDGYKSDCKLCRKAPYNPLTYKKWYQSNKSKKLGDVAAWSKLNNHYTRAKCAKSRACKIQATPDWLGKEYLDDIKEFYWLAKDLQTITGELYHVDHIVPLQGETVCGLHVPWNLQVLPADINLSKGNSYADYA